MYLEPSTKSEVVSQILYGEKFKVLTLGEKGFVIEGQLKDLENQKIQWGLAKDDVTPQDIFRMTNEGPDKKGIIAKYCIQEHKAG